MGGNLIVRDLSGYEEKIGGIPLFIIVGKVDNQSGLRKKHINVKVIIFNQNKVKGAEKEAMCGRIVTREELKNLPPEFFAGEMIIKPQKEDEMVIPSGKATPFMVVFEDLPTHAKEFKVEILEAPNL